MAAKKGTKGGAGGEDAEEELTRVPFQAILLADSFATLFRPITLERPKVLLPLVNAPMIDYTLAWLESAGVEEVFVFCCAHSKQVIEYLENSNWFGKPNFSVTTIESHNAISAGDALRLIYERHVIQGDFVLVTGDTVSNMSLAQVLKEHKERRRKDSNAVMTMVIKQSKPSAVTRQSRVGTEELFLAIDPDTKQLLHYEEKSDNMKGTVNLDKGLLVDNSSISLHNDKQDCYIDICSPEVLSLFTDNFDYQHLRRHFVKGLLVDDIMGYKIFTHDIHASYATRVDNYRSYGTINKDIIQRWTYPFVPDVQFSGNCVTRLERQGIYRASDVGLSHSAHIGPFAVIGNGTTIGNYTYVSNSVIGEGCVIGSNVSIDGCYIWDKVTIEDCCKLKHAIVCDGVIMRSGAVLEPGVVLSFKVIIGEQFIVPAYSKVSLLQQPVKHDSDEELEYADNSSVNIEISSISSTPEQMDEELREKLSDPQTNAASEVGNGGAGFIWSISEAGHEEEWRHSVAPVPADRLVEMIKSATDELEVSNQDGDVLPPSGELERYSIDSDFDGDVRDDSAHFEKEVEATFLRAVHENVKEDHVILEVNSLRLSYNLTSSDCAGALFYGMMKLALDTPNNSLGELVKNVSSVITKWRRLLKYYLASLDEEIEVILKFEEMCLESTKEFAPLFEQEGRSENYFQMRRVIGNFLSRVFAQLDKIHDGDEILPILYDKDILQEEAILNWAAEKEEADESDKVFLKQAEKFIQWLNEASEEE